MITVALDWEHTRRSEAGTTRCARALLAALGRRNDVMAIPLGGGARRPLRTLLRRLSTLRQDLWWYPVAVRRHARRAAAQVLHCPTPRAPLRRGTPPLVVTIHDLASLRHPETLTPWSRLYDRATIRRVAHAADLVLVPSRDTAQDVELLLGVPAPNIRVVPNGVDDFFFFAEASDAPFDFPYVLFVGTPQPRKNLGRLSAAVRELQSRGFPHRLVVAGADGWGSVELPGEVHTVGHVGDHDLRRLYNHAACLAIVSLHEGFGLPAIEAMAAGTPVVASRAGALPEVTGDAAVLADPLDVHSIATALREAIERRDRLIPLGRRRARLFSWDAAAEATVSAYRELV